MTLQPPTHERQELAYRVFENILEGVIVCDSELRIRMVNPAFSAITGFTGEQAIGQTPRILSSGRHDPDFYRAMWETIGHTGHWEGEIWNRRRSGEVYPEYLSITALKDEHGSVRHYIGVFTDISHRKLSDHQLHRLVHYDSLTDLPNRETFRQQLKTRIVRARTNQRRIAVLFIDIDHFKSVNDSLGHSQGNALLQIVAERLKKALREGDPNRLPDVLARLGGDEFVALVDDLALTEHAALVAKELMQRIEAPISLGGVNLHVSASIGIVVYPDSADNVDDLLLHAELAMHHVKQNGRANQQFFTQAMRDHVKRQMALRSALHGALERQQFYLLFQPQVVASSGRIGCMEALLRWRSPELGEVMPAEFISVLEETGEIEQIGHWVLEEAMRQCLAWQTHSSSPTRVSVNLSARQMRSGLIAEQIADALQRIGLPAGCLELELTESLAMDDVNTTQRALESLHDLGVRIAIDDFGTGYSSLSYLQHFYLDALKIDRSFVHRCTENRHEREIIRATLALAHSMGLEVIAEGVETEAQRDFLVGQGIDLLQGYLFSVPVDADTSTDLIEQYNGTTDSSSPTGD